jgi:hypothetical protein
MYLFLLKLSVGIMLLANCAPVLGICKWVDEDGVVHYAESCPEDQEGSTVDMAPQPGSAEVEAARLRSEQLREGRAERKQAEQAAEAESRDQRAR